MNECNPDDLNTSFNQKPKFTQWEQESFTDDLYSARQYLYNLYQSSLRLRLEQTHPELFSALMQALNQTQNAIDQLSNLPAVAELIKRLDVESY